MAKPHDEFDSELARSTRELKSFKDAVKLNTEALIITTAATKQAKKEEEEQAEKVQKMATALVSGTRSALSFGKSLTDGKGSFAPLKTVFSAVTKGLAAFAGVFGPVGKIVGAAIKAAGEVANFIVDRFDATYGVFTRLSDSGVVGSFEDLYSGVESTRMGFDQMAGALEKHSKDLALFAGSATKGTNVFKAVASGSLDLRRQYQKLGISTEDFAEFQLSYLSMEMRTAAGKKKTNDELVAGTSEYIDTLDTMSKLTGMSRKAINDEMMDRQKNDARFRAWAIDAPKIQKDNLLKMLTVVSGKTKSKELTQGLSDFIIGNTNTKEASLLSRAVGDTSVLEKLREASKKGETEYMAQLGIVFKTAEVNMDKQQAVIINQTKDSEMTAVYVGIKEANIKTDKSLVEELIEAEIAQKKAKEQTEGIGPAAANTKQSMEQAAINIDLLATGSDMTAAAMKIFSGAIENVTEKFYEMGGKALPPLLVARKKERLLIEQQSSASKNLIEAQARLAKFGSREGGRVDGARNERDKAQEELNKIEVELKDAKEETERLAKQAHASNRTSSDSGTSPPGAQISGGSSNYQRQPGAGESHPDMTAGPPKLTTITSKEGKTAQVKEKAAPQFQKLLDWFGKAGYGINSLGGYNDRNIAGTNMPSWHSSGEAIDINPAKNPYGSQRITDMPDGTGAAAASFGLGWGANWPNIKDAMHFSTGPNEGGRIMARTGGIFTDPGDMSDNADENSSNVGQQALNTSTLTGNNGSVSLDEIYETVSEKMNTLINLMVTSQRNQHDKMMKPYR